MISRIWHGWTRPEQANQYEQLLKSEVLPGIAAKNVPGYLGVHVLRRNLGTAEVEFTVIMWFETLDAVKKFAGEDYERAYVPQKAREVLARFEEHSAHYEVRAELTY